MNESRAHIQSAADLVRITGRTPEVTLPYSQAVATQAKSIAGCIDGRVGHCNIPIVAPGVGIVARSKIAPGHFDLMTTINMQSVVSPQNSHLIQRKM